MIFDEWQLAHLNARNKVVRSATYEGYGDAHGLPRPELGRLYQTLAENHVGTIITGFAYVNHRGRAMHPAQTSIASDHAVPAWKAVLEPVRALPVRTVMLLQLAHAGLQTIPGAIGAPPLAPSVWRSPYFRARPKAMSNEEIEETICDFAKAAERAKSAGFDGVQLHAAHGYLIHQFLSPFVNRRKDRWGRDRFLFFAEVVKAIRSLCGESYPIFVKLSVPDGHPGGIDVPLACKYAAKMQALGIEAIEVSYGTMDQALNIFRGELPIECVFRVNPFYRSRPRWVLAFVKRFIVPYLRRQLIPFTENYNLSAAAALKAATSLPVVVVGGLRRYTELEAILVSRKADAVALCRPLICEPDLLTRFLEQRSYVSRCNQCNRCAVMCDYTIPLRCYQTHNARSAP
jgi:2,4-dienoyl-CoA reductase-like NADH-dependent reductase (Old Yellow Enzyme family)